MTEIYLGGGFNITSDVELTDLEVDGIYHALSGLTIEVNIPVALAEKLRTTVSHFAYIDEVEVLN